MFVIILCDFCSCGNLFVMWSDRDASRTCIRHWMVLFGSSSKRHFQSSCARQRQDAAWNRISQSTKCNFVVALGSRTQCPELPWNARGVTKCALGPRGKDDRQRSVRAAARAQARMGTATPDGHAFVGEPRKRVHQTRLGEGVKIAIFLL